MIYYETGLDLHLTDARVKFVSRVAKLIYKWAEESMPEAYESLKILFKDHSQEEWSELSFAAMNTAFKLIFLLSSLSSFIFVSEIVFFYYINCLILIFMLFSVMHVKFTFK